MKPLVTLLLAIDIGHTALQRTLECGPGLSGLN